MQSSNGDNPYTETLLPTKRKWKAGAAVLSLLSVAGGFGANAWLNPPTTETTLASPASTTNAPTVAPDKTVTSDQIPYEYGFVQLTVTRSAGKISAIDVGNSTANNGREAAYPYLVDYALKAQGTNFANLSGATYTTDTFKQALDSAISKLG